VEATEEELAQAATKISAAFKGKKARQEVSQMKSEAHASATIASGAAGEEPTAVVEDPKPEGTPADGDNEGK
jgi:hypothetical protein